jgi:hypothetical protein
MIRFSAGLPLPGLALRGLGFFKHFYAEFGVLFLTIVIFFLQSRNLSYALFQFFDHPLSFFLKIVHKALLIPLSGEFLAALANYSPVFPGFPLALLLLTGLAGSSDLALCGRPIRTLRSISSTLGSYTASLVIGWIPAVSIRFRVASTEIFSALASSETVIPSILSLSDILQEKLKKVSNFVEIYLDKVSNIFDTYSIG